jgi:hypothetical protein
MKCCEAGAHRTKYEKGAKQQLYEENMRRKREDEEPCKFPESFTVGCGYLPQLNCYPSVQCRNTAFASSLRTR